MHCIKWKDGNYNGFCDTGNRCFACCCYDSILDNLFIAIEENGVSVNLISEDSENNYATLDLSKKYSDDAVRKIINAWIYWMLPILFLS